MLLGIVVVIIIAIGLFTLRNFGSRLVERLPLPDKAKELYEHFEEGVFSIDRRTMPMVALLTLVIWTTEAMRLLFVVDALGFDISLGISGAFFVALVASLLTAVPFTPAGLGHRGGRHRGPADRGLRRKCQRGRSHRPGRSRHQRAFGHHPRLHRLPALTQDEGRTADRATDDEADPPKPGSARIPMENTPSRKRPRPSRGTAPGRRERGRGRGDSI